MLHRAKQDPRPIVWGVLRRQFWMTREEVAREAKIAPSTAGAVLTMFAKAGDVDRMPGSQGKLQYRKRKDNYGTDKATAQNRRRAGDNAAEGAERAST